MAQSGAASKGHGGTPEATRVAVLALLLAGRSVEAAARAHELASSTVRSWLEPGKDFRAEYDAAIAAMRRENLDALIGAQQVAIDTLAKAAEAGDVQAASTLLRATTAAKHEHSGPGGGPIATVQMPPANDAAALAELEQIQARIAETIAKRKVGG